MRLTKKKSTYSRHSVTNSNSLNINTKELIDNADTVTILIVVGFLDVLAVLRALGHRSSQMSVSDKQVRLILR